jgi:hypothetical protein
MRNGVACRVYSCYVSSYVYTKFSTIVGFFVGRHCQRKTVYFWASVLS